MAAGVRLWRPHRRSEHLDPLAGKDRVERGGELGVPIAEHKPEPAQVVADLHQLSKAVYGTSHTISLAEAKHVYQQGAARLIFGAGQFDTVRLSDEATAYFKQNDCQVELLPTPEAIPVWNAAAGAVIGLLHVTC